MEALLPGGGNTNTSEALDEALAWARGRNWTNEWLVLVDEDPTVRFTEAEYLPQSSQVRAVFPLRVTGPPARITPVPRTWGGGGDEKRAVFLFLFAQEHSAFLASSKVVVFGRLCLALSGVEQRVLFSCARCPLFCSFVYMHGSRCPFLLL